MSMDQPETARILAFLYEIGLPVEIAPLTEDSFLPGIRIVGGRLQLAPDEPFHPGDLLHEAGHIAVTAPAERDSLDAVSNDPGEEMAAIAWSYAASVAIGLDPAVLFHPEGYRGGSAALIRAFTGGGDVGVPLLEWFGMTTGRRNAERTGAAPYPHMSRWLR